MNRPEGPPPIDEKELRLAEEQHPRAPELTPEEEEQLGFANSMALIRTLIDGAATRLDHLGDGGPQDDPPGPIKNLRTARRELEGALGAVAHGKMHFALELAVLGAVDGMTADYRLLEQNADERIERLEAERTSLIKDATTHTQRLGEITVELRLTTEERDRYKTKVEDWEKHREKLEKGGSLGGTNSGKTRAGRAELFAAALESLLTPAQIAGPKGAEALAEKVRPRVVAIAALWNDRETNEAARAAFNQGVPDNFRLWLETWEPGPVLVKAESGIAASIRAIRKKYSVRRS